MKFTAAIIALLLAPSTSQCKRGDSQLADATAIARKVTDQLANNPNMTPEETARLRHEKAAAVEKIESIADSEPNDTETQLEVGKSLASVEEASRAIPYAERGLRLAEASSDPKLLREALLTSSEVFHKSGNYAFARERAQRILKDSPRDKDALALYMQVKDRGAASAIKSPITNGPPARTHSPPAPAAQPRRQSMPEPTDLPLPPALQNEAANDPSLDRAAKHYSSHCASSDKYSCAAAQISRNCFDSSVKNICVRNCLVTDDEQCVKLDAAQMPGCRVKSHIRCYVFCRKFVPNIIETSCYTKLWGSFLGDTE